MGKLVYLVSFLLIYLIRGYQIIISPFIPACCRYNPTCSSYAIEALTTLGLWRGLSLSLNRLLKCHPWGGHGYDPLPSVLKPKFQNISLEKTATKND